MAQTKDKPEDYPSRFQRRSLWSAITALSFVVIAAIAVGGVMLTSWILGYLNPILVPVAVAGIVAYLLDPLITLLTRRGLKRKLAFTLVFVGFNGLALLLAFLVIKPAVSEGRDFWRKYLTAEPVAVAAAAVAAPGGEAGPDPAAEPAAAGGAAGATGAAPGATGDKSRERDGAGEGEGSPSAEDASAEKGSAGANWFGRTKLGKLMVEKLQWIDSKIGSLPFAERFKREDQSWDVEGLTTWGWQRISGFADEATAFFGRGFSSATSFLGYFLGLFLVPVYLFFFLRESNTIAETWSNYLPLRQSAFKDEVVDTLKEINQYLIAYFRGQMVVSLIDGLLVAVALSILGLDYALLLGVFLAILGLIPYLGNLLVMIPAVLIAFAQYSDPAEQFSWLPQVWAYPLIVLGIFVVLQQVNGLFTAPKIVGDSVGLHPLTVIFSMLFWSLLLGGLLGALLAVPLTASLKVLFRRYVWERRLEPAVEARLSGNSHGTPERRDEPAGS